MTDVGLRVMDVSSARRLTERIRLNAVAVRDGVEKLQALLEEAKEGNVHVALGYPSWPAYIAEVMGDEPLRLSRDDRREIVHYLTGEGMSTRAVGSVLGVSDGTVRNDMVERPGAQNYAPHRPPSVVNRSPSEVLDPDPVGSAFIGDEFSIENAEPGHEPDPIAPLPPTSTPAPRTPITGLDGKTYTPPPPRAPSEPRRKPLTDAFFDAVYDLGKKAETVRRLVDDDRFPQNAAKVAAKHRNDLLRIRDLIDQVLAQLPTEGDSR